MDEPAASDQVEVEVFTYADGECLEDVIAEDSDEPAVCVEAYTEAELEPVTRGHELADLSLVAVRSSAGDLIVVPSDGDVR